MFIPKRPIFLFLALFVSFLVFGQNYNSIEFIENKGQWDSRVRFTGAIPGGTFFIHQDGFTVVQHNSADLSQMQESLHSHAGSSEKAMTQKNTLRSHAYKVQFVNGSGKAQIIADKALSTYNNYFIGNDPSKWAANCKIYLGITLKDVYPNVDVRYYSGNGQLKYDLLVKPGADVSKIALKYEGVDKLEVQKGELVVKTSVGSVKELAPYTYQHTGKERREVKAKYVLDGNVVRFNVRRLR